MRALFSAAPDAFELAGEFLLVAVIAGDLLGDIRQAARDRSGGVAKDGFGEQRSQWFDEFGGEFFEERHGRSCREIR